MKLNELVTDAENPNPDAALWAEWEAFQNRKGPRFVYDATTFEEFKEHKRLFAEAQEYLKQTLGKDYRPPREH